MVWSVYVWDQCGVISSFLLCDCTVGSVENGSVGSQFVGVCVVMVVKMCVGMKRSERS